MISCLGEVGFLDVDSLPVKERSNGKPGTRRGAVLFPCVLLFYNVKIRTRTRREVTALASFASSICVVIVDSEPKGLRRIFPSSYRIAELQGGERQVFCFTGITLYIFCNALQSRNRGPTRVGFKQPRPWRQVPRLRTVARNPPQSIMDPTTRTLRAVDIVSLEQAGWDCSTGKAR